MKIESTAEKLTRLAEVLKKMRHHRDKQAQAKKVKKGKRK